MHCKLTFNYSEMITVEILHPSLWHILKIMLICNLKLFSFLKQSGENSEAPYIYFRN